MSAIQATQLGDKYILLDMLGSGGMAEVFRAKQLGKRGFEKQIVIKRLLPHVAQDTEMVDLFIGEARLAAMLQHENIPAIYDFGEIDRCYFLAMEYLSGVDLHTLLTRCRELGKPLETRYALKITAKVCEAMEYAHRLKDFHNKPLKIIHRDLTPHNIFITYDGKVKVIDFGVAKAEILDNKTRTGIIKGKLSYMSPEQVSGEEIDSRSDIFSIGILLYEMLSSRRMYQGDTATLIQKSLTADYERLQDIVSDLPKELYNILDQSLARDREKRYQSCGQVQADIEDLIFSFTKRTNSKNLQNYVRTLFEEEYEESQAKATLAMESKITVAAVHPPRHDKTVVLQMASPEVTIANNSNTKTKHRHIRKVGAWMPTNRRFLIGAAALPLMLLATLCLSVMLKNEDVSTDSSSASLTSSPVLPANLTIQDNSQTIDELTKKAELNLAANRLVEPIDDCAFKYYKEILKLEPDNTQALSGMDKIGDHLATQAYLEYKELNVTKANHYVDIGLKVLPDQKRLLALKKELANLEKADRFADLAEKSMSQNRIAESRGYINKGLAESPRYERLLSLKAHNLRVTEVAVNRLTEKVKKRIEQNKLTTPLNDSALTYLNAIEKIDPDNMVVTKGYLEIADRYTSLADGAYRVFNINKAKNYVNKGLKVAPNHRRLLALKAELSKSKPEILLNSMQKNIGTLLNNIK